MIIKLSFRSLAIPFLTLSCVVGIAEMSESRTLAVRIRRLPQLDGSTKVELDVNGLVHLPNGESNGVLPPSFEFDSISEFKAAAIGEWTIEDPMTPFSPRETFKFQVSDFFDTISSIGPPTIVSPTDGSSVPPVFTMAWAWPSGVTPQNSKATRIEKFGPGTRAGASSSAHAPSSDLSEEMMAEYSSGGVPARVEVRAGSFHPMLLGSFFSDVVPQQDPSNNTYTIRTDFYSYSLPARLFVGVPEPNFITLTGIGIVIVTMYDRRRKCSDV